MPDDFDVCLLAHRFDDPLPSGIGRYYDDVVAALRALDPAPATWRVVGGARPRSDGASRTAHVDFGRDNRPWYLAWGTLGWPPGDRHLGSPDLVHQLHAFAPIITRCPLVTTVHDLLPFQHPSWYSRRERLLHRSSLRVVADRAAAIVVDSAFVGDQLVDEAGIDRSRITVVPLAVDAGLWQSVPTAGSTHLGELTTLARIGVHPRRYLIAVGQLTDRKNLTVVLDALSDVPPEVVPTLVIAGSSGPGASRVHAAIAARGLNDRVVLAGYLSQADLAVVVANAFALVHPSLAEGFGLPPLEAMASGVPTISSAAGSLPEVVGRAGDLVDPHDAAAWATGIVELSDTDTWARRRRDGLARADAYGWPAHAAALVELYRAVLSR